MDLNNEVTYEQYITPIREAHERFKNLLANEPGPEIIFGRRTKFQTMEQGWEETRKIHLPEVATHTLWGQFGEAFNGGAYTVFSMIADAMNAIEDKYAGKQPSKFEVGMETLIAVKQLMQKLQDEFNE